MSKSEEKVAKKKVSTVKKSTSSGKKATATKKVGSKKATVKATTKKTATKKLAVKRVKKAKVEQPKVYAYKVMKRMRDEKLHSASVPTSSALHKVYSETEVNEVDAKLYEAGFGILVFPLLEQAQMFSGNNGGVREIWKVEVDSLTNPAPKRPSIYSLHRIGGETIEGQLEQIGRYIARSSWPEGTQMARTVRLVEKVVDDE